MHFMSKKTSDSRFELKELVSLTASEHVEIIGGSDGMTINTIPDNPESSSTAATQTRVYGPPYQSKSKKKNYGGGGSVKFM
jgi:hypothetical protein